MKEEIKKYLNTIVEIKMDRPLGSKHPRHDFKYELNYGFVPNTKNTDGEEIDAYAIGPNTPVDRFVGKCIAIIHRLNDDDDKLVIVDEKNLDITDEELLRLTNFQEKYFNSVIIRA